MLRRELLLLAPPTALDASAAALFRQYDWIRYDRQTVTGSLATRFVAAHFPERRGHLEFDDTAAIVAMVSAGLGISILQIADPGLLRRYPVRSLRLGRGAPVLQLSLVSRKADDDSRAPRGVARGDAVDAGECAAGALIFVGVPRLRGTSGGRSGTIHRQEREGRKGKADQSN